MFYLYLTILALSYIGIMQVTLLNYKNFKLEKLKIFDINNKKIKFIINNLCWGFGAYIILTIFWYLDPASLIFGSFWKVHNISFFAALFGWIIMFVLCAALFIATFISIIASKIKKINLLKQDNVKYFLRLINIFIYGTVILSAFAFSFVNIWIFTVSYNITVASSQFINFFLLALFLPWVITFIVKLLFLIIYHYQFKTMTQELKTTKKLKFLWNIKIFNNKFLLLLLIIALFLLPIVIMANFYYRAFSGYGIYIIPGLTIYILIHSYWWSKSKKSTIYNNRLKNKFDNKLKLLNAIRHINLKKEGKE